MKSFNIPLYLLGLLPFFTAKAQTNLLEQRIDELLKNRSASFWLTNNTASASGKSYRLKELSTAKTHAARKVPEMEQHEAHYPASAHLTYTDPFTGQAFTFKADSATAPAIRPVQHFNLRSDAWPGEYFVVSYNHVNKQLVSVGYRGPGNHTLQYDFDAGTGEINNYSCKVTALQNGENTTDNKQYIFAILDLNGKEGSDEVRCLNRGRALQRIIHELMNRNNACVNRPYRFGLDEAGLVSDIDSLMLLIRNKPSILTLVNEPVWEYYKENIVQVKCSVEKQADYTFRYSDFEGVKTRRGRITNTLLNKSFEEAILKHISTGNPTLNCLDLFVTFEVVLVIEDGKCVAVVW